jgi:outer membrane protein
MIAALPLALLLAAAAPPVVTLPQAEQAARESQPTLRQARAATGVAEAVADQARGALMPRLDANLAYNGTSTNASWRPGASSSGVGSRADSWAGTPFWSMGATASMVVWDFGGTWGRWSTARENAKAQQSSERATAANVLLNVRTAFFTARARKDLVKVAEETLANQEVHLKQIQAFVEVGTRPEIDLAQARTDRANAEVTRIGAVANYQTARAQLNQAMGIEASSDFDVSNDQLPPVDGESAPLEALVEEALKARPEVAALEAELRAQDWAITSARGGWYPSIGLQGNLFQTGPGWDTYKAWSWNWTAAATLNWNLFAGGATRAQVREAELGLESIRAQLSSLRLQVRLELEQARFAVSSALAKQVATAEALASARERLRLAEGRYLAGSGSVIEQADAQLQVTQAAAQSVGAEYELSTARAQLLQALARP